MMTLVCIAIVNAVTVLPLAAVAALVSRCAQRPALTHLLWALILVKFVTPPVFNLPWQLQLPEPLAAFSAESARPTTVEPAPPGQFPGRLTQQKTVPPRQEPAAIGTVAAAPASAVEKNSPRSEQPARPRLQTQAESGRPSSTRAMLPSWGVRLHLLPLLMGLWFAGSIAWLALQMMRTVRFGRHVFRHAVAPTELQEQTAVLARRLGLRRVPLLLVVDAAISPMLWGCGRRTRLLFPAELAERLDDDARGTLLAHELAHFSRGDQWVRLLELLVSTLFWWHPVVWWARWQIEESEEECCDAWVVQRFQEAPRQYAEALLDTIDFLCEARQVLPPVASGLGHAPFLRRRLTRILAGETSPLTSRRMRGTVAVAAIILLPIQHFVFATPSLSQPAIAPGSILSPPTLSRPASPGETIEGQDRGSVDRVEDDRVNPVSRPSGAPAVVTPAKTTSQRTRAARGERIWASAVSPDGRFLVQASTARRITLTDLSTDSEMDLSGDSISALAFGPRGDWFATAGRDGAIVIRDSLDAQPRRTLATHDDSLRSVAASPLGTTIAAGSRDGSVYLIDISTEMTLAEVVRFPAAVNSVRFSPDGRTLAIATGDWMSNGPGEVALFDVASRQKRRTIPCESAPGAVSFASNEELIVGLWNGQTQLWNLPRHQIVGTAFADKRVVSAAAFSPDNPALQEVEFVARNELPQLLRGTLDAASRAVSSRSN